MDQVVLRVVLFRDADEPGTWIAQALERDIAAHGADIDHAKRALERTVEGYIRFALAHQQPPLLSLNPAPRPYWEMWATAAAATVQAERIGAGSAYVLPVVSYDQVPAGL